MRLGIGQRLGNKGKSWGRDKDKNKDWDRDEDKDKSRRMKLY